MGSSPISFSFIDVEFELQDVMELQGWLSQVVAQENCFVGSLTFLFCSDEHLLNINRAHLNHDYYTDVITFDESRLPLLKGSILISLDRIKDNALSQGVDPLLEMYRVMVHGLLHLIGYGDKTPEQQKVMREKEDQALKMLH